MIHPAARQKGRQLVRAIKTFLVVMSIPPIYCMIIFLLSTGYRMKGVDATLSGVVFSRQRKDVSRDSCYAIANIYYDKADNTLHWIGIFTTTSRAPLPKKETR
jgi:hypothetical protein